MIVLRMLALLAGALVLILPPMVLADAHTTNLPGPSVAVGLLGLAVVAASFVYVGVAGDRMRRHRFQRTLGGALLLVPIAGSLAILATRTAPAQLWGGAILLGFSLLLFLSFVYPAVDRRQRPMRRRERQEPALRQFPHRT